MRYIGQVNGICVLVSILVFQQPAFAATTETQPRTVLSWNSAAIQGIRDSKLGAPMAARMVAVVHTCMYDAWAAYDERAVFRSAKASGCQSATGQTI
jgi:hypothetical protein